MSKLQIEAETFERELPNLAAQEGKFALVVGTEVVGTFETYADAVQAGYLKAGIGASFLVKKITTFGEAAHFSRSFPLCPA